MTEKNRKRFLLVRHAESLGNIGFNTSYDPDLSPTGYVQASECAEFLKNSCDKQTLILASPFKRCVRTASAIAKAAKLRFYLEPALHEYFAVEWYPLNRVKLPLLNEIALSNPFVAQSNYPEGQWWPEKNETEEDMNLRLGLLRNRLLSGRFPQPTIICVGHWASIASLANSMCPGLFMANVGNAAVTEILYDGKSCSRGFVNKTNFLSEKTRKPDNLTEGST